MSINKKGSRKIIVNDHEYRWKIKEQFLYDLTILIEKTNCKKPLYVHIKDPEHHNFPQPIIKKRSEIKYFPIPIKPCDIKNLIIYSLEKGWEPESKKTYFLNFNSISDFYLSSNNAQLQII